MTASDIPKVIHLVYSYENGSWAVESDQMPSLFAGGDSWEDAKALAHQAVHDELGDALTIFDWLPVPHELESVIASKPANDAAEPETKRPAETAEPFSWTGPTPALS
jgi:hypothetical protein